MSFRSGRPTMKFSRRLGGGAHPLRGRVDRVERLSRPMRGILDRAADQAGPGAHPNRVGDRPGVVAETVLEVGADRQVGRRHDGARVLHHPVTADGVVPLPDREGKSGARGRQGLEPQARQEPRRPRVPGVGQDERPAPLVQGPERARPFRLGPHRGLRPPPHRSGSGARDRLARGVLRGRSSSSARWSESRRPLCCWRAARIRQS